MRHDIQAVGKCATCGAEGVTCRYNRFEKDDLRIDAWEHKCPNCGARETTAFRSDDEPDGPPRDPELCPYCGRRGVNVAEA